MAYEDDFGIDNWDDPFGGDFDMDMDFDMDPFKNKGFVSSMTSGFLSGLVNETVGSNTSRIRTLRTILPDTFSNAFERGNRIAERFESLKEEFKEQNVDSVRSLQTIAGAINAKFGANLPSMVKDSFEDFSQKDFTDWERSEGYTNQGPQIEETSEWELSSLVNGLMENQEELFTGLSVSLNSMTAAAAGSVSSAVMAGNRQLVNIESGVRDLLDWQRHVQLKMDQAKVNLMAKNYVASIKYYKFMEAGIHTQVSELKKIVKGVMMSEYQKTSTFTAGKQYLRESVFSTIGQRMGGLTGAIRSRFGKEARGEMADKVSGPLGMLASMLDMSDGMPISRGMIGDMLGQGLAGMAVDNLPHLLQSKPVQDAMKRLGAANPQAAQRFTKMYGDLAKTGSRASYMANAGVGMVNHMAQDWQALDEMPFLDYQDYVNSLPPGKKPMSKARWTIQNAATNRGRAALNSFMSEMSEARGTQYTLKRRDPKDMVTAGVWTKANNITLTEVIPGLISRTNQLLEMIRTGDSNAEMVSYNYMRGQFQNETQKQVSVQADLMPYSEFNRYATAALEFVDDLDPERKLSAGARRQFAQVIAKDVDREKSFNPYYYLAEIPGISGSVLHEIHAVVRAHFGLKSDDVKRYRESSGMDRLKIMTEMPTAESQERLNKAGASANNLKDTFPNVAERIDMLRATGNEQLLRDLGVIYTENGIDKVNIDLFHERVAKFMEDPTNPILKGTIPGQGGSGKPTRNSFDIPNRKNQNAANDAGSFAGLNSSLNKLTERLEEMAKGNPQAQPSSEKTAYFDPQTGEISSNIARIADSSSKMEAMFGSLMEMAVAGRLFVGEPAKPADVKEEEKVGKTIYQRLKQVLPKGLASKGMELMVKNSPMILGGILGGLGGNLLSNPIAGVAVTIGGVALGGLVQHWAKKDLAAATAGQEPSDEENVINEEGETILEASKLKAGMYVDAVTRRVINTYREIKGPIIDLATKAVIGIRELGQKLFGADGRAVMIRGIKAAKDAVIAGYNFVNPLGRLQSMVNMGKSMLYQQDIFLKSDLTKPRLRAIGFKNVEYWKDDNGTYTPVKGWNEIDGAVYDEEGNTLITKEEFEDGLVTKSGQVVRNVGTAASNMMGAGAGLARAGFDNLMGRFGFQKAGQDTEGPVSDVSHRTAKTGGVERRLDRIYKLLSQKFGIDVPDDTIDGHSPAMRMNSLEDKARQAEAAKDAEVKDAIIDIGNSLGGKKKKQKGEGEEDKKEGLFGKLFSMMGNFMRNPIGSILGGIGGSLAASAKRLAGIGTALFSGVLGITSPLYKLMKFGFSGIMKGLAFAVGKRGASAAADLGDIPGGGSGGRGGRRGRGGRTARGGKPGGRSMFRGKLPGWLGLGAMVGGTALTYMTDDDGGDDLMYEGTNAPNVFNQKAPERSAADWAETAASFHPVVGLGTMAAEAILPSSAVDFMKNTGLYFGSDGKFFSDRRDYEQYEANLKGFESEGSTYRMVPLSESIQKRVRYAMYGISDWRSELAQRVERLEMLLIPHTVMNGNSASFKDHEKVIQIYEQFTQAAGQLSDNVNTWFQARFKPIFLTATAITNKARFSDLTAYDRNKNHEAVVVAERIREVVGMLPQNPYNIDVVIDPETPLMATERTNAVVGQLMNELRKAYPTAESKVTTTLKTYDEQRNANLNPERSDNAVVGWFQDKFGDGQLKRAQERIDERYVSPAEVKEIDISDLHKDGDTPIDPFTMARLAVYGNVDNMPWRVDAVLKLERYTERKMRMQGDKPVFKGTTQETFELFKALFRVEDKIATGNWSDWFENRFLPVALEYYRQVYMHRGQVPSIGWKQLTATNKAEIATALSDLMVEYQTRLTSIWDIRVGPFTSSQSGDKSDRAQLYIGALDSAAMQATLRDPVKEAENSKKLKEKELDAIANKRIVEQQNNERMFRTMNGGAAMKPPPAANSYAPNGFANSFMAPANQGNTAYQGGFIENMNVDFQKNGNDKGITMTPEQGEQLLLNALLKAGVTDTKQLALALALAKVETGNFRSTAENTNWSADTMLRLFKNVPDRGTAERIAALPPEQRAMFVYGTNPKARSLGNEKPEDGWRYRGRGFFQLTGKANYEKYARESGIDVVNHPELVSEDPNVVADSAVRYLLGNSAIKSIASTGDFDTAVRGINGGNAVPFTDQRRSAYQDYLNKLQNGSLKVKASMEAPKPPASLTPGSDLTPDQVPSAADKNVPDASKDRVAGNGGSPFPGLGLPDPAKASVSAGVPTPSSPSASAPVSLAPKQSVPTSVSAPSGSSGTTSSSTAGSSSTPSTSAPPMLTRPPEANKPAVPTGPSKVSDEGLAQIMGAAVQQLVTISDQLRQQAEAQGGNSTNYVGMR